MVKINMWCFHTYQLFPKRNFSIVRRCIQGWDFRKLKITTGYFLLLYKVQMVEILWLLDILYCRTIPRIASTGYFLRWVTVEMRHFKCRLLDTLLSVLSILVTLPNIWLFWTVYCFVRT